MKRYSRDVDFFHCTIETKKSFTQEENTCDYCLKILKNENKGNVNYLDS